MIFILEGNSCWLKIGERIGEEQDWRSTMTSWKTSIICVSDGSGLKSDSVSISLMNCIFFIRVGSWYIECQVIP